ncbi:M48 family metalloprotease [Streptomyces virginiae]|uniref:M48 family metalloprotease n=1 Tax=Streptomyces virginiae TaxID=1961 RepID=UPI0022565504|nr:M48 family metalloprotease [Streptomyces virginiae]MCX4958733.1 M48 family metalloprotease [Streptomyces virginiae]
MDPISDPAPDHRPTDDLAYRHTPGTRVTYRARQRAVDLTAWLRLALHLPGFLLSLALVAGTALALDAWIGMPAWIPVALWTGSGALVFHRPTEQRIARHLLRLHRPLPHELAVLAPIWHEVTARAGIDGRRYQLWIEDSNDINALAAAGHIVGVTRHALERLPRSQLAAVLAHELGHHTGGHAWAGLLGQWYGLPARTAWRALDRLRVRAVRSLTPMSALVIVVAVGYLTHRTLAATYGLPLLLFALPWLAAAVGRRAELRADAHAAGLGFAPMLVALLRQVLAEEEGESPQGPELFDRLLSSHPDPRTRLHHLQRYLDRKGRQTPETPQGGHPLG